MAKINSLIKSQYTKVTIDDVDMKFKKLTWKEASSFDEFSKSLNIEDTSLNPTVEMCKYIFKNFVRDENGDTTIDENQVEELPISFCAEVLNKFIELSTGSDKKEDVKKN